MKDKECRRKIKLLFAKIGHEKDEWYTDEKGEWRFDANESTGIMRGLVSLLDRIEALEKFLGIELITDSLFEYRKLKRKDAGHQDKP